MGTRFLLIRPTMTILIQAIFILWIAIALVEVLIFLARLLLAVFAFGIACTLQMIASLVGIFWSLWRTAFLEIGNRKCPVPKTGKSAEEASHCPRRPPHPLPRLGGNIFK